MSKPSTSTGGTKNSKRGHAIILTHEEFDSKLNLESLPSANKDEENARLCLESLGFTIHSHKDLTNRQLINLADETTRWDHKNGDCLVVVISTHGDDGLLCSKDGVYYLQQYVEKFAAIQSLDGKPKIFIVDACRGENYDRGVLMEISQKVTTDSNSITTNEDSTIPLSDCLILYSSSKGYFSWLGKDGSWFISSFFDVLQRNVYKNDILSIMRETSRKVAFDLKLNTNNETSNFTIKQMPTLHSYLTRKFQFQKIPGKTERIIPPCVDKLSDKILPFYEMKHKNRGKAIIFNFENFNENMLALIKNQQLNQVRHENVEKNIGNLKKTLENYRFNVKIFPDLNSDDFIKELDKLSKYNHTDSDCLMIIINTCEYEKKILLRDRLIEPYEIFNYFFGNNCTTLIGKPKLFFVNITNGYVSPNGLSNDFKSLVSDECVRNNKHISNENAQSINPNKEYTLIPETADILIMYSSPLEMTYDCNDSFFLKELNAQLLSNLETKDEPEEILDILTEVSRCVSWNNNILYDDKKKSTKIIPRIVSTLTRELYLK